MNPELTSCCMSHSQLPPGMAVSFRLSLKPQYRFNLLSFLHPTPPTPSKINEIPCSQKLKKKHYSRRVLALLEDPSPSSYLAVLLNLWRDKFTYQKIGNSRLNCGDEVKTTLTLEEQEEFWADVREISVKYDTNEKIVIYAKYNGRFSYDLRMDVVYDVEAFLETGLFKWVKVVETASKAATTKHRGNWQRALRRLCLGAESALSPRGGTLDQKKP
ncbi:hypothetical protein EVAR_84416_1 [Eumeta japonica]|uniref:Uncharacterized protein n=1 Tax=Eumeta variegata TaxID=151549 RepID=A0A4C1W494_EUMVA|nr:hypothetical protein EVAR_84416_1 [Eumeta japonica]